MKVEIKEEKKDKEISYPFLGINDDDDLIILFRDKGRGTVVMSADTSAIGEWVDGFNMNSWRPFTGIVNLRN